MNDLKISAGAFALVTGIVGFGMMLAPFGDGILILFGGGLRLMSLIVAAIAVARNDGRAAGGGALAIFLGTGLLLATNH